MDVYLAPGHGRRPNGTLDNGAAGGGTNEQEAGDRIARESERILVQEYGLRVHRQPRGGPNFVGTRDEVARIGARVSLTIHHDWSGAPRGGFGFARPGEERLKIGDAILARYRAHGLPTRPHLRSIPGTNSPPSLYSRGTPTLILWEVDRIGEGTPLHARAIAEGLAAYLGQKPKEGGESKPQPKPSSQPRKEAIVATIEDLKKAISETQGRPDPLVRERLNEAVRLGQAAAAGAVAAIRHEVGLPPDAASDAIHVQRIRNGTLGGKPYGLEQVRERLEQAARDRT